MVKDIISIQWIHKFSFFAFCNLQKFQFMYSMTYTYCLRCSKANLQYFRFLKKICTPINHQCQRLVWILKSKHFFSNMEGNQVVMIKQVLNTFAVCVCGIAKVPQIRQLASTGSTEGLSFLNLCLELYW